MVDDTVTERIAAIAAPHRARWWQRRSAMFEVHYWDDDTTRAAVDDAGAAAAVTGNVWSATFDRSPSTNRMFLHPDETFSEALFKIVEATTGIDAGTLWVDISPDRVTVRGVEGRGPRRNRHRQQRRAARLADRALTITRAELTTSGAAPPSSALRLSQKLRTYPPYDDSLNDVRDYTRFVTSMVEQLDEAGWSRHWARWVDALGSDDAVAGTVADAAAALRAGWQLVGSSVSAQSISRILDAIERHIEVRVVAERHGVEPGAVLELIDDDVATDTIGDLISVAYQ